MTTRPEKQERRILSSFRLKSILTVFFVLLLVALSGMTFVLVTRIFDELSPTIKADLHWKVQRGAQELSRAVDLGLLAGKKEMIERALGAYRTDRDVLAIVVTDGSGKVLVSHGTLPESTKDLFRGSAGQIRTTSSYLVSWAPSLFEGQPIGKVAVVASTSRLQEGQRLRQRILLVAGIGCVVALFLSLIFVRYYIQPIIALTEKSLEELKELNITLEKRVQQRTADLRSSTEELQRAYERLAEYDQHKSRFFANVSHELRTPLTLVLTPLQILLESAQNLPPAQVKGKLSSIQGNIHRLLRMVNQLLDFSAIESGSATVAFEQRDLLALLEPIVRDFEPFARSKGLSLMLRGPDDLPRVYVDPEKLEKVVSNLLSNACKFTDEGGTVVVRLRSNDREVSLSVKDSGSGISDEDLPKIFERFRQLDDAASRRYQGSGIGLALAKELVELTGGRIEAESELGYGSTFTVYLPLGTDHIQEPSLIRSQSHEDGQTVHAAATASALEAEQGREQMRPEREARKGPMVLVVEDHADMRGLVVEICEQEFQVMEAADGKQGLEQIREHRPDLVISDVMMPEMDGLELLRRLRSDPITQSIPVMLLTALAGSEMRLDGLERGADDYLPKPFNSRELLARARNLIRLKQQEQELRELNAKLQQELVDHASKLERARMLQRYLPPETVNAVLEDGLPVQVEQKRCRLTTFRMELRGFEELLEYVQPEDMATMLNGYLSEMVDVAFEHGATVDNLIRDTITGFFGSPRSEGNRQDAIRCARMALQMWERAVEIRERWREFLGCKPPVPTVVMASGYATVGNYGSSNRLEYTAVGGPMDEASALLPAVGPGEVVCSQSTHTLLHGEIESEFCGETTLGHSSRPAKLYRIAGPPPTGALDSAFEDTEVDSGDSSRSASPRAGSSDTPRTAPVPRSGDIIAERYKVANQLGKGGMGIVFKVRDQKLNTDVALKLLRHDLDPDRQASDRLYREVKLARLVSHTNVARIYDVGDWDGHEFITMEYIDGETLGHRLKIKGAPPMDEAKSLLRQVCAGLLAAHTAGIIHRDLKPHNIMMEKTGRAVILDFGIAKWAANLQHTGTDTQKMLGTPFYMAPEQFQEGRVDNRTDIYALGVVAFEMVTGQRPFDASSSVAMAYKHTEEDPPDPLELRPNLPPRLAAVILRCMEKSPGDRFSSVNEILSLLV